MELLLSNREVLAQSDIAAAFPAAAAQWWGNLCSHLASRSCCGLQGARYSAMSKEITKQSGNHISPLEVLSLNLLRKICFVLFTVKMQEILVQLICRLSPPIRNYSWEWTSSSFLGITTTGLNRIFCSHIFESLKCLLYVSMLYIWSDKIPLADGFLIVLTN